MPYKTRALAVVLMLLLVAVGCSRTTTGQRASQAPPPSTPAATATPSAATVEAVPIPGHPPITTTGVVAKIDPQAGVLVFQDGRTVKLTQQSKVLTPVDLAAVRPGTPVIVRNAMPVAVQSAKVSGKRQKVGTVAAVDQQNQMVRLTDGSAVRVSPSTNMHMGTQGATVVLTELRPGDELVIVMTDAPAAATGAAPPTSSTTDPSALPRSVITGAPSDPSDAVELMVFREQQAP